MNKQEIARRLLALTSEIGVAEEAVLKADRQLIAAKEVLQKKEDDLWLGNVIDGKNAEIRAAQMRRHTDYQREVLSEAELKFKNAVSKLGRLKDELGALQAFSRLLHGGAA